VQIEDLRPEDLHGPDEQQAVVDYLEGCGFHVLDRNWQVPDGRLELVAAEQNVFVVIDIRRPHKRWHRPLHDISHVRRRQLRLLAAAWLTAHGQRFDQIRIDVIALTWNRGNGYTIEHVRGVGVQ
jgi:putative endonuclease